MVALKIIQSFEGPSGRRGMSRSLTESNAPDPYIAGERCPKPATTTRARARERKSGRRSAPGKSAHGDDDREGRGVVSHRLAESGVARDR